MHQDARAIAPLSLRQNSAVRLTVFAGAYLGLLVVGFLHWHLANGLLFLALWLTPPRAWLWLVIGVGLVRSAHGAMIGWTNGIDAPFLGYWNDAPAYVLGNWLEVALMAPAAWWLRRAGDTASQFDQPLQLVRLHIAALAAAALLSLKDIAYVLNDGTVSDVRLNQLSDTVHVEVAGASTLLAYFALKSLLGHFLGIVLMAPIGAWVSNPANHPGSRSVLRAGWLAVPMALLLLLLSMYARDASSLLELLRLIMLVALVIFAMRHGWRGATVALFATSLLIAIEDHLGLAAQSPVWLQLFVAISGAMALLLGATVDGLRRQEADLWRAQRRLRLLADELRDAAARNLQVEERERRRLATELHDEFGQNLAALQTHLKLAEPTFRSVGKQGVIGDLLELCRLMHSGIRGVLDSLRPGGLDELGLFGAIDRGVLRRLAEDSGLAFETRLEGDSRLLAALDETRSIAIYRVAQESLTNVVRHARATCVTVRLRVSARRGTIYLFLDVRDDGVGRLDMLHRRGGLVGMRDRVLALGGRMHLRQLEPGLRLHVLVPQALTDRDVPL